MENLTEAVDGISKHDRDLERQLKRAASSILLNLAEGLRRTGRDRRHLLSIALGSAAEVRAIIDIAVRWTWIDEALAARLEALADRECAMLYRLHQKAR